MSKRGQSLLESFMLLIIIIGLVMPVLFFSADKLGNSFKISQAEDSLNNIAITARAVSSLGEGNSDVSIISIPEGVTDFYVDYDTLVFTLNNEEIMVKLDGEIIGNLPTIAGIHEIKVVALGNQKVKIGNGPWIYYLDPNCMTYPLENMTDRISIAGVDFTEDSVVYFDGISLTEEMYGFDSSGNMAFLVGDGYFPPSLNG